MRIPFCAAALALTGAVFAQAPKAEAPRRLQAIIQVQRDSVGADIVKISILDPGYSVDTLRSQIDAIGKATGSGARGIQITANLIDPKDSNSKAIRATFAVDGLMDPKGEWLRVAPIVKALSTTSKPQLNEFQVDYDFERPQVKDLQDYSTPDVEIRRRVIDQSLEYTVSVIHPSPSGITVPDFASSVPTKAITTEKSRTDWFIVAIVGVAIAAGGALVYCLFLLNPLSARPRR